MDVLTNGQIRGQAQSKSVVSNRIEPSTRHSPLLDQSPNQQTDRLIDGQVMRPVVTFNSRTN